MSKPPREPEELTNWREFAKEAGRKEAASFKGCDVVEFGFLEAYDRGSSRDKGIPDHAAFVRVA